ncbi:MULTISPECIES: hypothetical protein [Cohnella]|uniref:hypothetical protein n=1 Tax=Cohnella TaxID=329857 RepID=UPI001119B0B2|nr:MULTISPECIES: hypothetical protein [Cohnella]MBN2981360.1 hypothetical protein [Cohnella algarum]
MSKKMTAAIASAAAIAVLGAGLVWALASPDKAANGREEKTAAGGETRSVSAPHATEESVIEAGSIETMDGQDLSIGLGGERSNNFAIIPWTKGETVEFSVENESESKLEIGIMSVATERIYSRIVEYGSETVAIPVPEDGEYRIYVKNHDSEAARFRLILSEPIEGPLV